MIWVPDNRFLDELRGNAGSHLSKLGLSRHLEDAIQMTWLAVYKSLKVQGKLDSLKHTERLAYLLRAVTNAAKHLARHNRTVCSFPDTIFAKSSAPDKLYRPVFKNLDDEERILVILLAYGFTQKQIAETLAVSESHISVKKKKMEQKIRHNIERKGANMAKPAHTDQQIYDFIDGNKNLLGNDNLKRAIERVLKPIRLGLSPILEGLGNPPIPKGLRERIDNMIKLHQEPPVISIILQQATSKWQEVEGRPSSLLEQCLGLLEAARLLNQPYRWVSPEDSLRAIENLDHAEQATRYLTEVVTLAVQIFVAIREREGQPQISRSLADKLENLAERFKSQRGTGCTPFITLPTPTVPSHLAAVEMNKSAEKAFQENLGIFKKACASMKSNGDSKATIRDMQELVDFLIRLLNWEMFDAPRYLGPALIEESIEVVRTVFRDESAECEKRDVFGELADLLFMALWFSNVLAIPNFGREIQQRLV